MGVAVKGRIAGIIYDIIGTIVNCFMHSFSGVI